MTVPGSKQTGYSLKLLDQRSGVLPDGSASQPGKELNPFQIAFLDPHQRLGLAGSRPVKEVCKQDEPATKNGACRTQHLCDEG